MKAKGKFTCPNCKYDINYNSSNIKKNLNSDGRIKCRECGFIFTKELSEKIKNYIGDKQIFIGLG